MATIRSASFTPEEDIQLCHAYLDVTQNPIVGNNQTGDSFWAKVRSEYEKTEVARRHQPREGRSLLCRMSTMMTGCAKFRGCINQINHQNPSGASEQDIISAAKELLRQDPKYRRGFKYDHVWDLLKDMEKLSTTQSSRAGTHQSRSSPSAARYSSSSLQDESSPTPESYTNAGEGPSNISQRPVGVKKAKRNQHNDDQMKKLLDQNERMIKAADERNAINRRKVEGKIMRDENKFLFQDVSAITDPVTMAFYEQERARIMHRRESETQDATHGGDWSGNQNDEDEEEPQEVPETQANPQEYGGSYMNLLTGDNIDFPGY